ncbi:MAG: PEP-CTERM sorting domain-containing protein [Gemmatimonadaceae bacterium]
MKLTRIKLLAVATSLALPALASAQQNFYYTGPKTNNVDVFGHGVGAYGMSTSPTLTNPFNVFCIDYDHTAPNKSTVANPMAFSAYSLTFKDATINSSTNFNALVKVLGTPALLSGTGYAATTASQYLTDLKAAAYLSTLFTSGNVGEWDNIHGAIWSIFSPNSALSTANYGANFISTYRNNAFTFVNNVATPANYFDDFHVIIDARAYNTYGNTYSQAFITSDPSVGPTSVVPEPSTYALFAAGLIGIAFARRRRNKKVVVA